MQNTETKKIFKGAVFLSIGAFLSKLLGALYRIPLTNILGGTGLGLYQMVFPVYCVLLDFAGAGAPNALSKIIAENGLLKREQTAYRYLKSSLKLLTVLGAIGFFVMLAFSYPVSLLQGNKNAYLGYIFMSPSVFFVAVLSCFRGYFQGLTDMKPTAISQIIEQVVKLVLGLLCVYILMPNTVLAVGGATFSVTVSEGVALLYVYTKYKKRKSRLGLSFYYDKGEYKKDLSQILKYVIPITLIGTAIPFSQFIDSFLIVNILKTYNEEATSLYGLYSGAGLTVVNLPVAVCYGVSVTVIPFVSGAKEKTKKERHSLTAILLTLTLAVPCSLILFFFSKPIVNILFNSLTEGDKIITANLIKTLSFNVVFLSLLQTENSVLIGNSKPYAPLVGLGFGIVLKTVLEIFLLKMPNLNIQGGAISSIACYFSANLVNFTMIFIDKVKNDSKELKPSGVSG